MRYAHNAKIYTFYVQCTLNIHSAVLAFTPCREEGIVRVNFGGGALRTGDCE